MKNLISLLKIVFFLWSLLLYQILNAQLIPADSAKIAELSHRLFKEGKLHGGVLIAEGDRIIYQGAFGLADKKLSISNTIHTRFFDASLGKMFTAVLILQLKEMKKLSLEDPISKHLQWFKHKRAEDITIHHLLSHRSGLASIFSEQKKADPFQTSQRELLKKIMAIDLIFEPGTAFNYSNTGYVLLGEVIMNYLGKDYNQILQERIFKPLDMENTYWSRAVYGPGAPVYYRQDGSPVIPDPGLDFTGPGAEKTTLKDMHKFMLAVGSNKLLSAESWDLAFQSHSLPKEAKSKWGPHLSPYGYGFSLLELPYAADKQGLAVGHGGTGEGISCYALRFKEHNRIVILWNNVFIPPLPRELIEELAKM